MDSPAVVAAADTAAPDTVVVEAPAVEETLAVAPPVVAQAPPPSPRRTEPARPQERRSAELPPATSGPGQARAPGIRTGEARYAVTWVNVREARSTSAAVVRILNPGELVRVRDYEGGWWEAMLDGKPIGYIGNSVLRREPIGPGTDGRSSSEG